MNLVLGYFFTSRLYVLQKQNNRIVRGRNYTINHNKNIDAFNESYKKINHEKDKFGSLSINYQPMISKIYELPKAHRPGFLLRSTICETVPHNITKL